MSLIPKVRQVRRETVISDGSLRFEVTNQIFDQGDMPFPHLFVMTINDSSSPKSDVLARIATPVDVRQADSAAPIYVKVTSTDLIEIGTDTFARIANVNDITRLPRDRVTAVLLGRKEYLTTAFALLYDNVTTAQAAAQSVVDRLSTLVTEWRSYNTQFATNPYADFTLPQVDASVEAQRTAVYVEKRNARIAADAARDSAQAAKDDCEQTCAADKTIYDFLAYDVAFLEAAKATVNAITEVFGSGPTLTLTGGTTLTAPQTYTIAATASTRAKDFVLGANTYSGNSSTYEALLTKKRADLATYAAKVRACSANCAALGAALLTAQQAADAALSAERAALADVVAVCPTFNPSTV
jgi:hypothetical protein